MTSNAPAVAAPIFPYTQRRRWGRSFSGHALLLTTLLAGGFCSLPAATEPPLRLGIAGDSLSDEYFETATRAHAKNWVQLLVEHRGLNVGPTAAAGRPDGTWGEPRGTGYQYNRAKASATSYSLASQGQLPGLVSQIASAGVNCVVLAIGANDFNIYSEAYLGIYNGTWPPARINAYAAKTFANIESTIIALRRTGVRLVLANLIDYGALPVTRAAPAVPDPAKRQRVTAVLQQFNTQLRDLTQKYQVPLGDWFGLQRAITGPLTNLHPVIWIGNVPIDLATTDPGPGPSANPTAAYLGDGYHPHTTIQGLFANRILEALNHACDTNFPLFTEAEILANAGLTYGGVDTLPARLGAYTTYVIHPVPLGPTGGFDFLFPTNHPTLTPVYDITGTYQGTTTDNRPRDYTFDVAMDETGKLAVHGSVTGLVPDNGGDIAGLIGTIRTVHGQPTIRLKGRFAGTLDNSPCTAHGFLRASLTGTNQVTGTTSYQARLDNITYRNANQPLEIQVPPTAAANLRHSWRLHLDLRRG